MKKIILTAAGVFMSMAALLAQSPAPDPDTLRDPVKQIDPEVKVLPQNENYDDNHVKITPGQIPSAVRQTLSAGTQYEGWEKGSIYRNKKGNKFTLEVTKADTTKTFHFDQAGRPLKE